jgi:hypothetical protein
MVDRFVEMESISHAHRTESLTVPPRFTLIRVTALSLLRCVECPAPLRQFGEHTT